MLPQIINSCSSDRLRIPGASHEDAANALTLNAQDAAAAASQWCSLINGLLCLDPAGRLSANCALRHPIFRPKTLNDRNPESNSCVISVSRSPPPLPEGPASCSSRETLHPDEGAMDSNSTQKFLGGDNKVPANRCNWSGKSSDEIDTVLAESVCDKSLPKMDESRVLTIAPTPRWSGLSLSFTRRSSRGSSRNVLGNEQRQLKAAEGVLHSTHLVKPQGHVDPPLPVALPSGLASSRLVSGGKITDAAGMSSWFQDGTKPSSLAGSDAVYAPLRRQPSIRGKVASNILLSASGIHSPVLNAGAQDVQVLQSAANATGNQPRERTVARRSSWWARRSSVDSSSASLLMLFLPPLYRRTPSPEPSCPEPSAPALAGASQPQSSSLASTVGRFIQFWPSRSAPVESVPDPAKNRDGLRPTSRTGRPRAQSLWGSFLKRRPDGGNHG